MPEFIFHVPTYPVFHAIQCFFLISYVQGPKWTNCFIWIAMTNGYCLFSCWKSLVEDLKVKKKTDHGTYSPIFFSLSSHVSKTGNKVRYISCHLLPLPWINLPNLGFGMISLIYFSQKGIDVTLATPNKEIKYWLNW